MLLRDFINRHKELDFIPHRRAKYTRSYYLKNIAAISKRPLKEKKKLNLRVYSYCGQSQYPEQVLSLRSFLRYAGVPIQFTILSDGSLNEDQKRVLESNHPCVKCLEIDDIATEEGRRMAQPFYECLKGHFFWKKLLLLISISQQEGISVYSDSDILFFDSAMPSALDSTEPEIYYLPDCNLASVTLDERLLRQADHKEDPVNGGFCVFGRKADWSSLYKRMENIQTAAYFTEQTLVHLMMHANDAKPLDKKRYILSIEDQGKRAKVPISSDTVLRHYVGGVRYRMWSLAPKFYR